MGDANGGHHPLDELAFEQQRQQSAVVARQWMISLEEYMRAGFTRWEAMQMLLAFAGRPPGMSVEDMERIFGQLFQAMRDEL